MRVLVLDTDYPQFLAWLYRAHPGLEEASYTEQLEARRASLFGTSQAYAAAFRELGHEAIEIHADNLPLQTAWAREHGLDVASRRSTRQQLRELARRVAGRSGDVPPFLVVREAERSLLARVLAEQARSFRPELVLNQSLFGIELSVLHELAGSAVLVGQHAATALPPDELLAPYALVVSSFEPTLAELRRRGIRAHLSRLGFDPHVLPKLGAPSGRRLGLTFVGSLAPIHASRRRLLEELVPLVPDLTVFTHDPIPAGSPLRERFAGSAWGREMYEVLRASRATVNHHGDVPAYANNLRLYEATGVGTLLLTDAKPNLGELFELGVEILAYDSAEDCAARYLALDDEARDRIAAAGQARTLAAHTYADRVAELVELARG
jgi:spore maturation protein CgeB